MCENPKNETNKNKANVSLKISAIYFSLLCQNLSANAILANNERERVTPAQNLSSFQSSNCRTYKATSVIVSNDSVFVIASKLDSLDSKLRGTSPQLRSGDLAHKREWAQLCKQNLFFTHCGVDCHDSRLFYKSLESRNDENPYWAKYFTNSSNDKSTHPLRHPSAREGEIIQNNESSTQTNPQKYIKLAQVDSIRTDFAQVAIASTQTDSNHNQNPNGDALHNNATRNNATNDNANQKAYDIDSSDTDSTNATAESMKIDSTSQAFDKPYRYNKLKSKNDLEKTNLEAKDLGKVSVTAIGFDTSLIQEQRNIIIIDKSELQNKGYATIQDALQNTQATFTYNGFNSPNIDIRGQGASASRAVKILQNGVPINLTDSPFAYNRTPINALSVQNIEKIEIIPGGGAVLYGNGTRGGVVNIITKKSNKNYFSAMIGDVFSEPKGVSNTQTTIALQGGINIKKVFAGLSGEYHDKNGYREGEKNRGYSLSGDIIYAINDSHRLSANINFYEEWLRFADGLTYAELQSNRRQWKSGNSQNEMKKTNASLSLNHNYRQNYGNDKNLTLDTTAFYAYDNNTYQNSAGYFFDNKAGLNFKSKYGYNKNGEVILGYEMLYAEGKRGSFQDVLANISSAMTRRQIVRNINHPRKISNSIFGLNRHYWLNRFNNGNHKAFSTSFGMRYENAVYLLERSTYQWGQNYNNGVAFVNPTIIDDTQKPKSTSHNLAIEILPSFEYSLTGNVYAKYERGFVSPSPSELTNKSANQTYYASGVKPETYDTLELGIKDEILGNPIGFSVFYTHTNDEIMYEALGNIFSGGWRYYNLDETHRAGAELYSKQRFWRLKFSQNLSYIFSRIAKGNNKGAKVPLVPDYKLAFDFGIEALKSTRHNLTLFINPIFYGNQRDSYNAKIKGYILTDIGGIYAYKWSEKSLELSFGVRNVADTKYNYLQYKNNGEYLYLPAWGRSFYAEMRFGI